jgi:hypothetical protein
MTQANLFAASMAAHSPQKVTGMIKRVANALAKREAFEQQKAPNALHIELQAAKAQLQGNKTVARLFLSIAADPDVVLNRERKRGYRANLKCIRKVRMLAEYMAGDNGKINGVCKALFAATILAGMSGKPWVSNNDAEKLLLQVPLSDLPQELADALAELRGLNIRDAKEARNQACQFRTAFENLGCYYVCKGNSDNLDQRGIVANNDSPLIQALAQRWGF